MTFLKESDRAFIVRVLAGIAVVLVVGLLVGTFVDYALTSALYAAEHPLGQIISAVGVMPLSLPLCFLLGAVAQRLLAGTRPTAFKVAMCVLMAVIALIAGFSTVKALFTYDGFGPLLPFTVGTPVIALLGLLVAAGLAYCGYRAATKNHEALLFRRALLAVVLLVGTFLLVEIIKNIMHRPRYRTLVLGYEDIEFSPWYLRTDGAHELMERYALGSDAFKSFPSGHSVQVGATMISFFGLAAVLPALRSSWRVAMIVSAVLMACVLVSRMVLGAHFLSDISVGALIPVLASIYLYSRRDVLS